MDITFRVETSTVIVITHIEIHIIYTRINVEPCCMKLIIIKNLVENMRDVGLSC